jgi:pimeloyl-ACP methyl ester carboxylesterase/class 3 adenylate cyclase
MATERRLAAIMFTDVVGSTAVTARSESAGLALRDRHRELVRTQVERYRGRFVEAPGDESLSTFESALDAVHAALAIEELVDAEPGLGLHVGIHLGETMFRGSEVFGDGVNIAARLCALSLGRGICVSGEVYQAIRNQPGIEVRSLGDHALKNVGRPVSVFALAKPGSLPATSVRHRWRALPRAFRVSLVLLAVIMGVSVTGYLLRRPLARVAVLGLLRMATPSYEQQIAFATTSDGVKIAYATVGQGPPLVVVPGWVTHIEHGFNSPVFDPLTPRLSAHHQVVRYDQRGTGVSDRNAGDLSLDGRVRDLEAVVDAIGAPRVALYGASTGGPPAILYTARHPDQVTRLALLGTFARKNEDERAQARLLAAAARTGWGRDHATIRKLISLNMLPEADEIGLQGLNELQRVAVEPEVAARFLELAAEIDVRDAARGIAVPTLILHVEGDRVTPFESGRELASLIPNARFVALPGINHIPTDDDLAPMLDALEAWLAKDLTEVP